MHKHPEKTCFLWTNLAVLIGESPDNIDLLKRIAYDFSLAISSLNSMSWNTALAGAGVNALLPIFTGGRRIVNLRLKQNKYKQMFEEYKKTSLVAIKEVNDSLSSLKLDNEKYEKNLKAYQIEEKKYDYARQKYDKGITSNLDLIQAKEVLLSTEKLAVSSNIDKYVSHISLYKATAAKL